MSRLLSLVLLCMFSCQICGSFPDDITNFCPGEGRLLDYILGQSLSDLFQWTERDKVEIIIKFKGSTSLSTTNSIGKFFGDYGNKYGLQWDEMDVTEREGCKNKTGLERYQAYIMDCNEFQKYLYHLKPRRYNIEMVHVICDRTAATICMARSCSPSEYKKMAMDSYDCIYSQPHYHRNSLK